MEVASRRGPGCELHARPFALLASFATRTASPVVRGFQNRLEWPRAPRAARWGGGGVWRGARVTERPARRETRRTIIPMRPSSAEDLVDLPYFGIYTLLARGSRGSRESRDSRNLENHSNLESTEMGCTSLHVGPLGLETRLRSTIFQGTSRDLDLGPTSTSRDVTKRHYSSKDDRYAYYGRHISSNEIEISILVQTGVYRLCAYFFQL